MREAARRTIKILAPIAAIGLLINSSCKAAEPARRPDMPKSSTTDIVAPTYIPASEIPIALIEPHLTAYINPSNPNVARHTAYIQRWCGSTGMPSIQRTREGRQIMVFSTTERDCPNKLSQKKS